MFLEYLTVKDFLKTKGFDSFSRFHQSIDEKLEKVVIVYPSYLSQLNARKSPLTKKGYFENIKYKYHPVLRVSKQQAKDYCHWRTEMVLYKWFLENKSIGKSIQYRLPTEEELKSAKTHFSQKNQLTMMNGKKPTRFDAQFEVTNYTLYPISEFTSTDAFFGKNWKEEQPTLFPNDVTGFRCVCDVVP